jgi:hypothetical protein
MTLAIQGPITRDPGPMTLAIRWPHVPGENVGSWPHVPGDRQRCIAKRVVRCWAVRACDLDIVENPRVEHGEELSIRVALEHPVESPRARPRNEHHWAVVSVRTVADKIHNLLDHDAAVKLPQGYARGLVDLPGRDVPLLRDRWADADQWSISGQVSGVTPLLAPTKQARPDAFGNLLLTFLGTGRLGAFGAAGAKASVAPFLIFLEAHAPGRLRVLRPRRKIAQRL